MTLCGLKHSVKLSIPINCCLNFGIQFKPLKCTFFAKEIQVLGHTNTKHGRKTNWKGIEAILSIDTPPNTTSLKRFLGLCNFFRDYIPNMPSRTKYLRELLKKGYALLLVNTSLQGIGGLRESSFNMTRGGG